MKINNVELNIDLFDADVTDRYQAAMKKVVEKSEETTKDASLTAGDIIRKECQIVFECFDTIFGDGTAKKLFGDRTNIKECLAAFIILSQESRSQTNEIHEMANQFVLEQNEPPTR